MFGVDLKQNTLDNTKYYKIVTDRTLSIVCPVALCSPDAAWSSLVLEFKSSISVYRVLPGERVCDSLSNLPSSADRCLSNDYKR